MLATSGCTGQIPKSGVQATDFSLGVCSGLTKSVKGVWGAGLLRGSLQHEMAQVNSCGVALSHKMSVWTVLGKQVCSREALMA